MCKVEEEDICRWDRCHCGLVDLEPSETRTKDRSQAHRQRHWSTQPPSGLKTKRRRSAELVLWPLQIKSWRKIVSGYQMCRPSGFSLSIFNTAAVRTQNHHLKWMWIGKEMLQNFKITLKLQRVRILNQRQVAAKIQQLEEAFLNQPGGSEGSGDSGEESSLPASSAEGARGCHDAGWAEV